VSETYDVVVLGGGSGADWLAPALAQAGRRVVVVEKRLLGGECPYFACMPSKALLHDALEHTDWSAAVRRRDEVAAQRDDSAVARRFADLGITVLRGHGVITGPGAVSVHGTDIQGTDLVINTGSVPIVPPIDGLDTVPTWTSDEALSSPELPARLTVLGGGPVGCELAQAYSSFGSSVTLVEAMDRLLAAEAEFVGTALAAALRAGGIDVRAGVSLDRVRDGRLHLSDGSEPATDRVLIAVGRRPAVRDIGLETLGIATDAPLDVDPACRVRGAEHLWAIGDVTGLAPFTHTANYQARIAVEALLGRPAAADYRGIPRAVYTTPAVYAVGLTPAKAHDQGLPITVEAQDVADTPGASSCTPTSPAGCSSARQGSASPPTLGWQRPRWPSQRRCPCATTPRLYTPSPRGERSWSRRCVGWLPRPRRVEMAEFPVEDVVEQQLPVLPEDDDQQVSAHGEDVDPAEAYEQDRVVPVDEDEWR
jgi:pyruvate/2-oxoglutarate dehydrogenase complex dihydrolipoamide dehydrogenase (E3) component